MGLTLVSSPQDTRGNGAICSFNYGYNDIYYDFQRKDKVITAQDSYKGGTETLFTISDNSIYTVGSTAYVYCTGTGTTIDGTYTVTAIITTNKIALNIPYRPITAPSGFINTSTRSNYRVSFRLLINGVYSSARQYHADDTGLCRCYCNNIINDYYEERAVIDFTQTNIYISNHCIEFRYSAKEDWSGTEGTWATFGSFNVWHAVKAVQQIDNDDRMLDYEVYVNSNTAYASGAKFLTAMEKPKMFKGYPFALGFLYGESVCQTKYLLVGQNDFIGNWVDTSIYNNKVVALPFPSTTIWFNARGSYVDCAIGSSTTLLPGATTYTLGTFNTGYVTTATPVSTFTILTELKRVYLDDTCNSGIYLKWENDLGFFDFWLFDGNIKDNIGITQQKYFDKNIDTLKNTRSNFEVLSKQYNEGIKCFGSFDIDNKEAFKQLLRSKNVEIYLDNTWYSVDVSGELHIETYNPLGKAELNILLNRKYIK